MSKNGNTHCISARFEYNAPIEGEVSDQATEEEIQDELDEAASMAIAENCQISNGLQSAMTVTRQDKDETIEEQPEKQWAYRYEVEVSTHQMLYQTVEMLADYPLTDEQIAEQAFEETQKGSWQQGTIDRRIAIDNVTEGELEVVEHFSPLLLTGKTKHTDMRHKRRIRSANKVGTDCSEEQTAYF